MGVGNLLYAGGRKDSITYPLKHSLSVVAGVDYVAPSVEDDIREKIPKEEKVSVNTSVPVHLRYGFSFTDPKTKNYLPGGYQGLGVGVLNLGGAQSYGSKKAYRNIGYPVMVYLYQGGPMHHFNKHLSLDYEWNFGAAIGWKPYSEANKYFNLTVGSQVNAYLNLNFCLNWRLNDQLGLFGGLGVSHFSNGNTSFPNPGINSFGMRVGMIWTLGNPEKTSIDGPAPVKGDILTEDSLSREKGGRKLQYDLSGWGATRKRVYRGGKEPVLLPGHFACAGISFAPMIRLNTWWRVGGSLDLQYDHSAGLPKQKDNEQEENPEEIRVEDLHAPFFKQVSVGLSAHGELQMPIFALNVGIGYNLVAPWENRGSYQNITLKTYVCERLYLNVGYQLRNFHQQSSLMLGLGVSL